MKTNIQMSGGTTATVTGKEFKHIINGQSFDLISHSTILATGFSVAHIASGKRVCFVDKGEHRVDSIAAARISIDKLIKRVGAERLSNELNEAPILTTEE